MCKTKNPDLPFSFIAKMNAFFEVDKAILFEGAGFYKNLLDSWERLLSFLSKAISILD